MNNIRNGMAIYVKFDTAFQAVYMTSSEQSVRVDYIECKEDDESAIAWKYLSDGYLPCDHVNAKPEIEEHEKLCYEFKRFNDRIEKRYFVIPENEKLPSDVPSPNRYSVRKIISEIRKLGRYDAFRSIIEDGKLDWDFVGANYLVDGDEDFEAMKSASVNSGIMTEAEQSQLLSKCIWTP